jgi:UDP-N-acetylmuramate--alanine ligase
MSNAPWASRRLHFIGIGGAGMSGLALVARALGAEVTGSDRADSPYCERLRAAGIHPAIGHDAANLPGGAEVVISTAIADDNAELAAARSAGAHVLHRGDLLAEAAALKRIIAVSGTHGKTTTSAMAAHALLACGREPAFLIGGTLRSAGTNASWGTGDWIVVEADESDRSFLKLSPEVALVTNMEIDHHATYRSPVELERAFAAFVEPAASRIAWVEAGLAGVTRTYGVESGDLVASHVEPTAFGSRFSVEGVAAELRLPGVHNVLNALGALAVCAEAGVEVAEAVQALRGFTGATRRFEPRGRTRAGARVYDDYAHHPTEVQATLEAARTLGARRVVACFQPHLYSRTKHLARRFGQALAQADVVVVLDVYPARESAEDHPGVSGRLVAAAAADASHGRPVYWAPRMEDAIDLLGGLLEEGDILLTMGAGDVDEVAAALAVEPVAVG